MENTKLCQILMYQGCFSGIHHAFDINKNIQKHEQNTLAIT